MRVLVAGHWDRGPGYPRTVALLAALRHSGHEVVECRVEPPRQSGSRAALAARPWRWPGYWAESRRTAGRMRDAVRSAVASAGCDVALVPYPGHLAVRWVRDAFDGPLVLDLFLSAWSTVVDDRRLFPAWSPPARLLRRLDRRAAAAADVALLDTPQHADDVRGRCGLAAERFDWVPVSDPADVEVRVLPPKPAGAPLRLLFFGTGVPLHGLPLWIDAVAATPGVHLTLFGGDPASRERARATLGPRLDLRAPFAAMDEIRAAIDAAHLVAGIVGGSAKARAVVPFKVVHGLAHGRPVLTADSPAARALLAPGRDCIVAAPASASALAVRLAEVAAWPHARLAAIGSAARQRFESSFSIPAVAARLDAALSRAVAASRATGPARSSAALVAEALSG